MKKQLYILLLLLSYGVLLQAQVDSVYYGVPAPKKEKVREKKEKPEFNWKEKTTFGGNFMIWFGQTTYIYLSPTANLQLTNRLNVGLGGIYNYIGRTGPDPYSVSIYGIHSYALFYVTQNVFAKVQFDELYQPNYNPYSAAKNVWVPYFLIGGGFRQPLGDHAVLMTSLLYLVNERSYSLYYNPMIQIGIFAGF